MRVDVAGGAFVEGHSAGRLSPQRGPLGAAMLQGVNAGQDELAALQCPLSGFRESYGVDGADAHVALLPELRLVATFDRRGAVTEDPGLRPGGPDVEKEAGAVAVKAGLRCR